MSFARTRAEIFKWGVPGGLLFGWVFTSVGSLLGAQMFDLSDFIHWVMVPLAYGFGAVSCWVQVIYLDTSEQFRGKLQVRKIRLKKVGLFLCVLLLLHALDRFLSQSPIVQTANYRG
jgi:hypothetical protein